MESSRRDPPGAGAGAGLGAGAAAAALSEAEAGRERLTGRVAVPAWFLPVLGAAVAAQIAGAAFGVGDDRPWLLCAGLAVFAGVAWLLLALFRRRSGVWLGGLASRVVLGTGTFASTAYVLALGAAIWAAVDGPAWLALACAVAGGAGYAVGGRRWLARYRAEPQRHARGEPALLLAAAGAAALAGLVLLLAGGR